MLRKALLGAALACTIFASPAFAAVEICETPGCATTEENVLIVKEIGPVIIGLTNNTHAGVLFTSPTGDNLSGDAGGQADVSAEDGLLNSLKFSLANGNTFGAATWNLFPIGGNALNEATQVILTYLLAGGGTASTAVDIAANGQNFQGIFGTAGERFISIEFIANPVTSGWQDLRQLRLGDVRGPGGGTPTPFGSVPEPGTWLSLLLGFGLLGMGLRRRSVGDGNRRLRVA